MHVMPLSSFWHIVGTGSEKAMAPHSSALARQTPWTEEPGRLQSMWLLWVGHGWATSLSLFTFMHWRRKWQPIPVSVLSWRIPGTGEPGGLPSMGSHRVAHDWSDLAAAGTGCEHLTHWERPWCWEGLMAGEEGDDRGWDGWIVKWLNGHEFEQTPRDSEGQGRLVCCSPRGRKELDLATEQQIIFNHIQMTGRSQSK